MHTDAEGAPAHPVDATYQQGDGSGMISGVGAYQKDLT
jgi:hypothetical protein